MIATQAPYPAAYTCWAGPLLTISRIGRLGLLLRRYRIGCRLAWRLEEFQLASP
jgi:hypothetical protein